jgi:hypothetical protein
MPQNETLGPDEYQCGLCRGVFIKTVSDEEADKEYRRLYPNAAASMPCRQNIRPSSMRLTTP